MLAEEQRRRYRRQMMLPEIGEDGQQKLGKARVLIVGLGGLGSISSYYLAAAGVGHLRIVDRDFVKLENLNRGLRRVREDFRKGSAMQSRYRRHLHFPDSSGLPLDRARASVIPAFSRHKARPCIPETPKSDRGFQSR